MSALTPICVACRLEMRCVKNMRLVCDPEAACGPSTYWYGDEYECPECKVRIVTGFGKPMEAPLGPRHPEAALQFDYERRQSRQQNGRDEERCHICDKGMYEGWLRCGQCARIVCEDHYSPVGEFDCTCFECLPPSRPPPEGTRQ